jgi:hypothetical protein
MTATGTWIIKSKHLNPNDFYVKVDGSDFYTAYWVANAASDQQATSLTLEASDELDLGQTEIQEAIVYTGQQLSSVPEIDSAIKAAVEKYAASSEAQLAAWVSSQGGKW